jgi:hypothetical protein
MSKQIAGALTNDKNDPNYFLGHVITNTFKVHGTAPDDVTVRLRLRPMGVDVLDDLVKSGDLDASVASKVPTYDVGELTGMVLEWNKAKNGFGCVP